MLWIIRIEPKDIKNKVYFYGSEIYRNQLKRYQKILQKKFFFRRKQTSKIINNQCNQRQKKRAKRE